MAEGDQINGAPPPNAADQINGAPPPNAADAATGALNLEVWFNDGWTYDSNNQRRTNAGAIIQPDLTNISLGDRIDPASIPTQLATDGSLLYRSAGGRWTSCTLRQLHDSTALHPLGPGSSYLLRTLAGLAYIHFEGSYLLETQATQDAEQVVLDFLTPFLPDLSQPHYASAEMDPQGLTLPLLQRNLARALAHQLQKPEGLVDVLITPQAMEGSRVATFQPVDVVTSRGTPTLAFSVTSTEATAHSLPRLGASPSFVISISLALQAPSNNLSLQDHLRSVSSPPQMGAALPEQGYQHLDPRLMDWGNAHPLLSSAIQFYKVFPRALSPFFKPFRAAASLKAPNEPNPQIFDSYLEYCTMAATLTAYIHPRGRHAQVMMDLLETWLAQTTLFCPWLRWSTAKNDLLLGIPFDPPQGHALIQVVEAFPQQNLQIWLRLSPRSSNQ